MMFEIFFLFTLAILNATIGEQQIPVEVQTRLLGDDTAVASGSSAAEAADVPPAPAVASPIPGVDLAAITAVAGVAGAAYAKFRKSASVDNAVADTTGRVTQSLKGTDYGIKDTAMINAEHANNLTAALSELEALRPETKAKLERSNQKVQENAKEWCQDVHEYYENIPSAPRAGELEGDKVKTKLAQVNKITEPTTEP